MVGSWVVPHKTPLKAIKARIPHFSMKTGEARNLRLRYEGAAWVPHEKECERGVWHFWRRRAWDHERSVQF